LHDGQTYCTAVVFPSLSIRREASLDSLSFYTQPDLFCNKACRLQSIAGVADIGVRAFGEVVMEAKPITTEEVKRRMDSGEVVVFLDSRSEDAWRKAESQIPISIRMPPDAVEAHLSEIPRRGLVVSYCT
jgi:hypothetical protein